MHVYSDGRPIETWDLDNQKPMKGAATRRILELIAKMEAEGGCEDSLGQTQQSEKGVRGRHIEDFFVALNLFDTFDSRPATTSVDRKDVGMGLIRLRGRVDYAA